MTISVYNEKRNLRSLNRILTPKISALVNNKCEDRCDFE